jgi:hypothetical protein
MEEKLSAAIFSGSNQAPLVYNEHELAGVEKNRLDLHATQRKKALRNFPPGDPAYTEMQKRIAFARKEASQVAADILGEYMGPEVAGRVEGETDFLDVDTEEWQFHEEKKLAA